MNLRLALQKANLHLEEIKGFLYCEGPGSTLGIRLSVMALRTWLTFPVFKNTPIYAYNSFRMGSALLQIEGTSPPFHIFSENRKDFWNVLSVSNKKKLPLLNQITTEQLSKLKGPFFHLPQHKSLLSSHRGQSLQYSLQKLPAIIKLPGLIRKVETPLPLVGSKTEYVKWNKERHR